MSLRSTGLLTMQFNTVLLCYGLKVPIAEVSLDAQSQNIVHVRFFQRVDNKPNRDAVQYCLNSVTGANEPTFEWFDNNQTLKMEWT